MLRRFIAFVLSFIFSVGFATKKIDPACDTNFVPFCERQLCCQEMGGISYCDSSAGRYVCNNGYYSSCYCTRHAVMDLQKIEGCCLWQGGVLTISPLGEVICRNGSISEICYSTLR